jgi:cell wall-associated NlpC family hydrolase
MHPGDLLFYTRGGRIGHVAMYIGDGKIVHASNERSGIKISEWNYRVPVKIISV